MTATHIKGIMISATILVVFFGHAGKAETNSKAQDSQSVYEKSGLQKVKKFHFTREEREKADLQILDGFNKQLELSDPETKAVILKARKELQKKKALQNTSEHIEN